MTDGPTDGHDMTDMRVHRKVIFPITRIVFERSKSRHKGVRKEVGDFRDVPAFKDQFMS